MIEHYDDHEMVKIIKGVGELYPDPEWTQRAAAVWLLFATGLRGDEARRIRMDDWMPGYLKVPFGKGGKPRVVELIPEMRGLMDHYLNAIRGAGRTSGPMFVGLQPSKVIWERMQTAGAVLQGCRREISKRRFVYWWDEVLETIDVRRLTPHAARRTFATWEAERLSMYELKDQLGHADFRMLEKYYRSSIPGRRYAKPLPLWRQAARKVSERYAGDSQVGNLPLPALRVSGAESSTK